MLHKTLTRRRFVTVMAATGMTLTGLLAACSDDDVDDEDVGAPDVEDEDEDEDQDEVDDEDEDQDEPVDEDVDDQQIESIDPATTTLRISRSEDIVDLHFDNLHIAGDRITVEQIYNRLVTFTPGTTELEPDVAEEWEVSDDGLTYTFNLRDNVQFHHGFGQLTSADVKATIEHHLDPDNGSRELVQYELVESVEAPDPLTVVIHLSESFAAFLGGSLGWQSGFIASAAAIEERGADLSFDPVGAGPYYFAEWLQGEQTTLEYFEDYFGDAPRFTTLQFRVIPDDSLAVLALEQGEIDVAAVRQLGAYREALNRPHVPLHLGPGGAQFFAYFQTQREPTDDINVRRALAHATDLQAIADSVDGMVKVNPSMLNPLLLGWTEDLTTYPYDLDRARELLAEAGYDDPSDVNLHMIYYVGQLFEPMALILQDMWTELGVSVQVELKEQALFAEAMRAGEWNVGIWSVARFESDQAVYPFIHSEGGSNYSQFNNPEGDQLIEQARVELDEERRAQLYVEIQELVAQELPLLTTGNQLGAIAARPGLTGIFIHPYPGLLAYQYVDIES